MYGCYATVFLDRVERLFLQRVLSVVCRSPVIKGNQLLFWKGYHMNLINVYYKDLFIVR